MGSGWPGAQSTPSQGDTVRAGVSTQWAGLTQKGREGWSQQPAATKLKQNRIVMTSQRCKAQTAEG